MFVLWLSLFCDLNCPYNNKKSWPSPLVHNEPDNLGWDLASWRSAAGITSWLKMQAVVFASMGSVPSWQWNFLEKILSKNILWIVRKFKDISEFDLIFRFLNNKIRISFYTWKRNHLWRPSCNSYTFRV